MDEKEIWLPVKSYEGIYEVSNFGRIRSLNYNHTGRIQILRPALGRGGYLRVHLCKDGKQHFKYVHRLVAEAFLANSKGLAEVNHIDENKANNAVTNLEYCDRAFNCNYGTRNERVAAANTNGKLSKPVQQLTKYGKLVAEYPSEHEAARQTGWSVANICKCCNGGHYLKGKWVNLYSYKGFKWQYA